MAGSPHMDELSPNLRALRSVPDGGARPAEIRDLWDAINEELTKKQRLRLLVSWSKALTRGQTREFAEACDRIIAQRKKPRGHP